MSDAGSGRGARWPGRRGPDGGVSLGSGPGSGSAFGSGSGSGSGSSLTGRRWIGALVLVAVAAALLLTFVRLPYFVFRPGSVQALSEMVIVTRGERFDPVGEVYFTTVRQDSTVNGWEYLEARLKGSLTLIGEDQVLGGRSRDENRSFNMRLMRVSKSTAVAVALRHLGVDPIEATGVGMAQVVGPSTGLLTTDDVILSVDGAEVREAIDLVHAIGGRVPGEVVRLEVEPVRGGTSRVVEVTLGEREDDPTIGFLGVVPQTRWEDVDDLPVDVLVNTGRVGGNSAGLALTLSILDLVTPGELTGGLRVATTARMIRTEVRPGNFAISFPQAVPREPYRPLRRRRHKCRCRNQPSRCIRFWNHPETTRVTWPRRAPGLLVARRRTEDPERQFSAV